MPVAGAHSYSRSNVADERGLPGATQWTRLFIMLASAAELFNAVLDVHRGTGSFNLLADAIIMVFIVAIAAIGLSILELNERFAALIALIGEETLLDGKE
jgi:hypothetical protein